MKDLHWVIVFAAILITPFLPILLKMVCPHCKKRKLQQLDTVKLHAEDEGSAFTYVALFRCESCQTLFKRKKSGPIEVSSREEHAIFMEAAVREVVDETAVN